MESSVSIDKRHSDRDVNKWFHESFKNSLIQRLYASRSIIIQA